MPLDLAPVLDILRRELPSLAGLYLFGSRATGDEAPLSAVDLAFLAGSSPPRAKVYALREALASVLARQVDLVELATAPTQMQVIGEGRLIDAPDPEAAALFELRVIRDYQELKRRRAEIEADIIERGRVHAG